MARLLSSILLLALYSTASAESLDILVYGATGKVGVHVVEEALNRGHRVTAVSRDPSQIQMQHENLTAVAGDLLDPDSIAALIKGRDVVIISVRGLIGSDKDPKNTLQYLAVTNVVEQLRAAGNDVTRLIDVGGSGSLEVAPGVLWADKIPKLFIPRSLELEIEGQVLVLEFLRGVGDVSWTYATPAKNFTNGERTGKFRIGGDQLMEDEHGRSRISRADFAVALIDEAEHAEHVRERFSVAY